MMKDRRIVSVIYETVCWLAEIVLPVLCAAYVSRVLGASSLGLFSRSLTVISYFTLPVTVCIREYGTRECVRHADDREKLETTASRIFMIQLAAGAVMSGCCAAVLCGLGHTETVYLIQSLRIIAAMLDVSWVLKGLEAFGKLAKIRIRVRTAAFLLTFLLVKPGARPLETYALIQAGSLVTASLVQAAVLYQYRFRFRYLPKGTARHIRPLLFIGIPSLALQVFCLMDRTMLGMMCEARELGLYSAADRYIHIPMGLMSAFFTVMMPHAVRLSGRKEELSGYLSRTLEITLFLCVIIGGVLGGCAGPFFRLFYGEEYAQCGRLALYLLPAVLSGAAGEWYRKLYLIPQDDTRQDILSVICGAAVNLAVNMRMIPRYGAYGAALGTAAAGVTLLFVQRVQLGACRIRPGITAEGRILCALLLYAGMDHFVASLELADLYSLALRIICGGLLALLCAVCLADRSVLYEMLYEDTEAEEMNGDDF